MAGEDGGGERRRPRRRGSGGCTARGVPYRGGVQQGGADQRWLPGDEHTAQRRGRKSVEGRAGIIPDPGQLIPCRVILGGHLSPIMRVLSIIYSQWAVIHGRSIE